MRYSERLLGPLAACVRSAVLSRVRLQPALLPQTSLFQIYGGRSRSFAEAAGTYLDKDEVKERVLNIVKGFEKVDPAKVTEKSHFQTDLGLDSLDTVEVMMAFEEEFALEIPDSEADKIFTTADVINYIASHPQAK